MPTSWTPLRDLNWIDLKISPDELRPENTMIMGQCFNWHFLGADQTETTEVNSHVNGKYWLGVLGSHPYIIRQLPHTTAVASLAMPSSCSMAAQNGSTAVEVISDMRSYFQCEESLTTLYGLWSSRCARMKQILPCLQGVRVLRQDPWECLISFICSSNNNIPRITMMLDRLRKAYGDYLGTVEIQRNESSGILEIIVKYDPGEVSQASTSSVNSPLTSKSSIKKKKKKTGGEAEINEKDVGAREDRLILDDPALPDHSLLYLYSFPTAETLSQRCSEDDLRTLGMGYRAKFILNSAKLLAAKPGGAGPWLHSLRNGAHDVKEDQVDGEEPSSTSRQLVQTALLELPGVGQKVADCVALFSLDQSETVPVDTHVWEIAIRDYAPHLRDSKSLTPAIYEQVGNVFRDLFQQRAGWAHSVLFAAELPAFRQLLPSHLQDDMKQFEDQQRQAKKELKQEKMMKNKTKGDVKRKSLEVSSTQGSTIKGSRKRKSEVCDSKESKQGKHQSRSDPTVQDQQTQLESKMPKTSTSTVRRSRNEGRLKIVYESVKTL